MQAFSTHIVKLRKKFGLTQSQLGKVLSITPQAISKWENGISEPDIRTLKKISEVFNVSIDYLLSDDNIIV